MRTMKFLMCFACLSSAAVFARTAMTQETPVTPPVTDKLVPADELPGLPPVGRPESLTIVGDELRREPRGQFTAPGGTSPVPDSNLPGPNFPAEYRDPESPIDARGFRRESTPSSPAMRPRRLTRTVIETVMEPIPQEELELSRKLQAAVHSLKTGKDEAARKAAADVIQQQLTTQFESDLKQREKELAEVEQRVKTLREQLNKRKASQAVIIDLRLQTLVNEADGLGFPDPNFGTDAQSAPTLYGDDLNRPVSRPRQVRQFRQSDPVDPDSRSRESDPHFFPDSP